MIANIYSDGDGKEIVMNADIKYNIGFASNKLLAILRKTRMSNNDHKRSTQ